MPVSTPLDSNAALQRVWYYKPNLRVLSLNDTWADRRRVIGTIKAALCTASGWIDKTGAPVTHLNPWTVCGTDTWTDPSNYAPGTALTMKQAALNNFSIYILSTYSWFSQSTVWFAPSGFSGVDGVGPTAAERYSAKVINAGFHVNNQGDNDAFSFGSFPANCAVHVMVSDDGKATRIWVYFNGVPGIFWAVEQSATLDSRWTSRVFWLWHSGYDSSFPTYAHLLDNANIVGVPNGGLSTFQMTSEMSGGQAMGRAFGKSDLNDAYGAYPIGLESTYTGQRTRMGAIADMWWGSTVVNEGDSYPADGSKSFVQVGDLILPWCGVEMATS